MYSYKCIQFAWAWKFFSSDLVNTEYYKNTIIIIIKKNHEVSSSYDALRQNLGVCMISVCVVSEDLIK